MKSLQDAIYNWLTIKVVCDARPSDSAAQETKELFENILKEDHKLTDLQVTKDSSMYHVFYNSNGEQNTKRFPIELVEILLNQINENPERYEIYTDE